jgi:hypothetical protein
MTKPHQTEWIIVFALAIKHLHPPHFGGFPQAFKELPD